MYIQQILPQSPEQAAVQPPDFLIELGGLDREALCFAVDTYDLSKPQEDTLKSVIPEQLLRDLLVGQGEERSLVLHSADPATTLLFDAGVWVMEHAEQALKHRAVFTPIMLEEDRPTDRIQIHNLRSLMTRLLDVEIIEDCEFPPLSVLPALPFEPIPAKHRQSPRPQLPFCGKRGRNELSLHATLYDNLNRYRS